MSSDLELLFERLTLMQKDVLTGSDAAPVAFYEQESYPFWTNRIVSGVQELDSQDYYRITYAIAMRLVTANMTENFETVAEQSLAVNIPVILDYFARRRMLCRGTADTVLTNLSPQGAIVTSLQTLYGQLDTGVGANQFGVEFVIEVPYEYQIDQVGAI